MMKPLTLFLLALTFASQGWGQAGGAQMDRVNLAGIDGTVYARGCVGDGSTDDTACLQNWVTLAAGKHLIIAEGSVGHVYKTGPLLTSASGGGTFIECKGQAQLVQSSGTNLLTLQSSGDRILSCAFSDSRSFVFATASYGIAFSGLSDIDLQGIRCSGFSYTCIGFNGATSPRIARVTCSNIGSMNDGSGHFEGRCVDALATTVTSTDVDIHDVRCTNVGKHCVNSQNVATQPSFVYAVQSFNLGHISCDTIGDTCVNWQDVEDGTVHDVHCFKDGQNTVNHLGQCENITGHAATTPSVDVEVTGMESAQSGENGLQIGFGAKRINASGIKAHGGGSCGVKIGDIVSEVKLSNVNADGNTIDGVCIRGSVTSSTTGTTSSGSGTFTDSNANFPTTITTGGYNGAGMDITIVGPSSTYFGVVTARASSTSITISPSPTFTLAGNATYWYGQLPRLIDLSGLSLNGNTQNGLNIQNALHVNVNGGTYCNNNTGLTSKAGILVQQSQSVHISGGEKLCDTQASPTQAYGERNFNSDSVTVEQYWGAGNTTALIAPTDGVSSNTTTEVGSGSLTRTNKFQIFSAALTPGAATASQCVEQTFNGYIGMSTSDKLSAVIPPSTLGAHIWIGSFRPSATNTLAISFCADATGGTPPSGAYSVIGVQ